MKMMKNAKWMLLCVTLCFLLTACGEKQYVDGVYYAEAAEFAASGWKETVEVTIVDGELNQINWDAIYKDESIPIHKKQYSKSGLYGMLAGGAGEEWYDQATIMENFVLENGVDSFFVDEEGHTDAVTGCTVHVIEFQKLLMECLEQAKK